MRRFISMASALALTGLAGGALAQSAPAAAPALSGGDTAWMLVCTVLVLLMTIPGILLFYSGMLRNKNMTAVCARG